jgi:uncharacterized protein with GYD domain
MPLFMSQFSYTPEAWAALTRNPEDRRPQLRQMTESLGGRLIDVYYSFGEYDGLTISEYPDETAATTGVLAAIGPGHIKSIKTTLLLTVEQTLEALKRANGLTYRGPQR